MVRRNVITDVGFFDEDLVGIEDHDYWLRISCHYQVECVGVALVKSADLKSSDQDNGSQPRSPLAVESHLKARNQFYRKHRMHMRREGLAHRFLVDSAYGHLAPESNDLRGARRLALQAFRHAPGSRAALALLLSLYAPTPMHKTLRRISSRLRSGIIRP